MTRKPRLKLTLRARLSLWAAVATGLAVMLVAVGLFFAVNNFLRQAQDAKLLSAASAVQGILESQLIQHEYMYNELFGNAMPTNAGLNHLTQNTPGFGSLELRFLKIVNNKLIQRNTSNFRKDLPIHLSQGIYMSKDQKSLIVVKVLLRNRATLQVMTDVTSLQEAQRAFGRAFLWLLPVVLLLSIVFGWIVAGRLLHPVCQLQKAAEDIQAGGDLRQPVPGAGHDDELSRLGLTLQNTFEHLASAREREQSFLRAAAHDLRSPLAALQARIDATLTRERDGLRYRKELNEIGTDVTRLSTLANHLLLLARDPSAMEHLPLSLLDLAADAVDRARELSPEADIDLEAPKDIEFIGDRVLLGQAIWNLTVNAVKHAEQATILVSLIDGSDKIEIAVQDDGPGIDAETLNRLGEAFFRPDQSRTGEGHGLGLALARRAAELHNGELVLKSAPGEGFRASIVLPIKQTLEG